jgi:hypothetical protein
MKLEVMNLDEGNAAERQNGFYPEAVIDDPEAVKATSRLELPTQPPEIRLNVFSRDEQIKVEQEFGAEMADDVRQLMIAMRRQMLETLRVAGNGREEMAARLAREQALDSLSQLVSAIHERTERGDPDAVLAIAHALELAARTVNEPAGVEKPDSGEITRTLDASSEPRQIEAPPAPPFERKRRIGNAVFRKIEEELKSYGWNINDYDPFAGAIAEAAATAVGGDIENPLELIRSLEINPEEARVALRHENGFDLSSLPNIPNTGNGTNPDLRKALDEMPRGADYFRQTVPGVTIIESPNGQELIFAIKRASPVKDTSALTGEIRSPAEMKDAPDADLTAQTRKLDIAVSEDAETTGLG